MEKNKHFLVGAFEDHDVLLKAVKQIREKGVKIYEVFTPYPVHGLEDALGYNRSWMPKAAFMFGALGTTLAITMQVGMLGYDWPMIFGGKPFVAIPDFVPVTFELTVLFAAFGMVGSFLISHDLKPHKVPRIFHIRATNEKLVMAIDLAKNTLSEEQISALLKETGSEEPFRKDFTDEDNEGSFVKYSGNLMKHGVTVSGRPLNK